MYDNQPVIFAPDKNRYWACRDDMEAKIFYLLSHQGVLWDNELKKRPVLNVIWFGLFSSQNLKCEKGTPVFELKHCPVCDARLVEFTNFDQELEGDTWVPVLDDAINTGEDWIEVRIPKSFIPT